MISLKLECKQSILGEDRSNMFLARALYQDADVYLLDDPFSSVDVHTVI